MDKSPGDAGPARKARLALRLAGSVILLGLLFWYAVDLRELLGRIAGADLRLLVLGIAISLCGEAISIVKWQVLLRHMGATVPFPRVVRASLAGTFLGFFLPGYVGADVARSLIVARDTGSRTVAFASAFMQRNTGLGVLLAVGNVAVAIKPLQVGLFPENIGLLNEVQFWLVLAGILFLVINAVLLSERMGRLLWEVPARRLEQADPASVMVTGVFSSGRRIAGRLHSALVSSRGAIPAALALSLCSQLADAAALACAAAAMGIAITFGDACVLLAVSSILVLVPVTVGGIGMRETACALVLARAGLGPVAGAALGLVQTGYQALIAVMGAVVIATGLQRNALPRD